MHIKQIRLDRFTSYKDNTSLDDLSSNVNVIVGRNGAGKSNLFAAIRFVLGELEKDPSRHQSRRSVVFSDRHSSTMQAWVEITFDNSDRRFPAFGDEIVIRRTSSPRADSYLLDGKPISLKELANFLESGGFTNTNPFYIVPQGRVTALAMASDKERLGVLLSVAGATLYDRKREQSVQMLTETDEELAKTNSRLSQIMSRLEGLRSEMSDLEKYLETMNQKHSIEYVLLKREAMRLEELMNSLSEGQETDVVARGKLQDALSAAEQDVQAAELAVNKVKNESELAHSVREGHRKSVTALKEELYRRQHEAEMMDSKLGSAGRSLDELEQELNGLQLRKTRLESELKQTALTIEPRQEELESLESAKRQFENRFAQFGAHETTEARNTWIEQQLKSLEVSLESLRRTMDSTQSSVQSLEAELATENQNLQTCEKEVDEQSQQVAKAGRDIASAEKSLEALESERNRCLLEVKKASVTATALEQKIQTSTKRLQRTIPQPVFNGLREIRQIAKDLGLSDKVYGTVAELVKVSPQFKLTAERVAGSSLLNMVVEDSLVAKQIIDELIARKAGTVTFLPLDLITTKPRPVLPVHGDEVELLCDFIECDPKFEPVVNNIFGRVLICSHLSVAQQYSKKTGFLAVTPEGNLADPRGIVSGGSSKRDVQSGSLFESMTQFAAMQRQLVELETGSREAAAKVESLRHQLTVAHNAVNKATIESQKQQRLLEEVRIREESAQALVDDTERQVGLRKSELAKLGRDIAASQAQIESYTRELADPGEVQVDHEAYVKLEVNVQELASELAELEQTQVAKERELGQVTAELIKQRELIANYNDSQATSDSPLGAIQRSIERTQAELSQKETAIGETTSKIELLESQLEEAAQKLSVSITARDDAARALVRLERSAHKQSLKLQTLQVLKEDNESKFREVRQVPELVDELEAKSTDLLDGMLNQVNQKLGEFDHVNKRSMEQFQNYSNEFKQLEERRDSLKADVKAVRDLIVRLDKDKETDIVRTFGKISTAFERIFKRLTGHKAHLNLKGNDELSSRIPEEDEEMADEADEALRTSFEDNQNEAPTTEEPLLVGEAATNSSFSGVELVVDFGDGVRQIQQLSGGQRTLCALALIFAIQSFDPAPFYIFDEVDASLDPVFRRAVAALIAEIANNQGAQFICTTFRPELVSIASQLYGVSFTKGASTVLPVTKETALSFVDASEETVNAVLEDMT